MPSLTMQTLTPLLIKSVILLIVGSIALALTAKKFTGKPHPFMHAIKVNVVIVIISFLVNLIVRLIPQSPSMSTIVLSLILSFANLYVAYFIVGVMMIKRTYKIGTKDAFVLWAGYIVTIATVSLITNSFEQTLKQLQLQQQIQSFQATQPPQQQLPPLDTGAASNPAATP